MLVLHPFVKFSLPIKERRGEKPTQSWIAFNNYFVCKLRQKENAKVMAANLKTKMITTNKEVETIKTVANSCDWSVYKCPARIKF